MSMFWNPAYLRPGQQVTADDFIIPDVNSFLSGLKFVQLFLATLPLTYELTEAVGYCSCDIIETFQMQEWENDPSATQHCRIDPEMISHTLFTIRANFTSVSTTEWPLNFA